MGKIAGHGTDIAGNRHFIIIKNNDKIFTESACIIESFIGKSACESAVSDDCNDMTRFPLQRSCLGNPKRRRNRSAAVSGSEGIPLTFLPVGKARESSLHTDRWKLIFAARQNFMCISLMADIPNNLIIW